MKNIMMIAPITRQMIQTCQSIQTAIDCVSAAESGNAETTAYDAIMYDNISHLQMMCLELTKIVAEQNENEDGVFAAGELDTGSREIENPVGNK